MKVFSKESRHVSWLIITIFAGVLADDSQRYEGYKVLRATPESERHLGILRKLRSDPEIDFWSFASVIGVNNTFSVSPKAFHNILGDFKHAHLPTDIIIDNLQKTLELEVEAQHRSNKLKELDSFITHDRYYRYDAIVEFAKDLNRSKDFVSTKVIGKTYEGRDIIAILLSTSNGQRNPGILVDAGIHGREWLAPATVIFLLDQIANNPAASKELLDGLDWYIIPVLNPDGYEYTFKGVESRLWRKNRSPTPKASCPGVDVNRNFGYRWNEVGGSTDPCSEVYSGEAAFTERESAALRDYMLINRGRLSMYLTLHSYGNFILHPWGFTFSPPADADKLRAIGEEANAAMVKAGSGNYKVGSSSTVLSPAAGCSDDYAKGELGIEKSFTIELPGGANMPGGGFDMPAYAIEKTARQVFEGLRVFARHARTT